jgi:autotransporter-associated beta strand protein
VISGAGIINNSDVTQTFVMQQGAAGAGSPVSFTNSASAGSHTFFDIYHNGFISFSDDSNAGEANFLNHGATNFVDGPAVMYFYGNSSAASATFTNTGGGGGATPGALLFFNENSTAANGTFRNGGSLDNYNSTGGATYFLGNSTAANGTFVNDGGADTELLGGGRTHFVESSTAQNATLIANASSTGGNGGAIFFADNSSGGTARVEVFGNGFLDISGHVAPGVTIGSLEGSGKVFLGANRLTVGANNLTTVFSGVLQDGGEVSGNGGSLTKTGSGTLTLSGANTYTGGTTIDAGRILVNNAMGSATGSGSVQVNAGTLGGSGRIGGRVTIGTGSGVGAFLSPGVDTGTLRIDSGLTLNSDANYQFELNRRTMTADQVIADGVTINGARISLNLSNGRPLASGTILTLIQNTGSSSIAGEFVNLADGSTFRSNGNLFGVNYEGGDGNDLTLVALKGKRPRTNAISIVPEPSGLILFGSGAALLAFTLFSNRISKTGGRLSH